jgi:hypothetical protein
MFFFGSARIRIWIELKFWIRIRIELKCWIRIRIQVSPDPQPWYQGIIGPNHVFLGPAYQIKLFRFSTKKKENMFEK